jgi:ATP/maltotriose-dependent transcriptional regulator MalT
VAQLRHAAGVADLPPLVAARGADELVATAILRPGRPLDFVHPLVRAAVYAGQAPTDRAEAHARAARLLALDLAEPGRVGVHLMSTEPGGDQWTVEALISAGRAALTQGVPRAAVGYLTRALAEPPPAALRGAVLRELGSAEQRVGDPGAIRHLREALALSQDMADTTATARALALGLLWSDRIGEVEEILDPTLRALAERDPEQAIQLEAEVLSAARLSLSAGLWGAERVERWRGRLAGNTPGERLMLANLATQTSLGDFTAHEAAALSDAAAGDGRLLAEQTADAMPFYQIVYVLTTADRVDRAEWLVSQADADARARGSVLGTMLASLFGSYTAFARGEVIEAEARVALALDLASQLEAPGFPLPPCVASLVDVLVERGRLDEAERVLEAHGMSGDLPDSVPFRLLLYSRGMLRLAQGRWEQSARDLLELGRRQAGWRALNPHLIAHDAAAALALAGLHDRESAVALAEQAVVRARRWGTGRAIGRALRTLALVGEDTERIRLLQEASAALADSPARLDHAHVLVDLGGALRRANRRSEASDALLRGLDMASSGGGLAVAARAREELHSLGLRPRRAALTGVNALSGSERRVVDLAAKGRSNPEIAQALYVTVRTVEVHLTHAYQKLGIQSRAQLAEALAR